MMEEGHICECWECDGEGEFENEAECKCCCGSGEHGEDFDCGAMVEGVPCDKCEGDGLVTVMLKCERCDGGGLDHKFITSGWQTTLFDDTAFRIRRCEECNLTEYKIKNRQLNPEIKEKK